MIGGKVKLFKKYLFARLEDKVIHSKAAKTIWCERDNETYSCLVIDKVFYFYKYHRLLIEIIVSVSGGFIGTFFGLWLCRLGII